MAFGKVSLKGRALRCLSQREHSRAELQRKLAPHEETPGELARVLDDLAAKDFISEARVVESVLHQKAPRLGAARPFGGAFHRWKYTPLAETERAAAEVLRRYDERKAP